MKGIDFAETMTVLPVLAPADIAATATNTAFVDLKNMHHLTFAVQFGNVASTDSTGGVVVTVQASTAASSGSEANVTFTYRLSSAVLTDTQGTITAATSSGVQVGAADDNKLLLVDIDPSAVASEKTDGRWVRVTLTPTTEVTVTLVGAVAYGRNRYPGNVIPSAT